MAKKAYWAVLDNSQNVIQHDGAPLIFPYGKKEIAEGWAGRLGGYVQRIICDEGSQPPSQKLKPPVLVWRRDRPFTKRGKQSPEATPLDNALVSQGAAYPCESCKGSGRIACHDCKGQAGFRSSAVRLLTGEVLIPEEFFSCTRCKGAGSIACATCDGAGQRTYRGWLPKSLEETLEMLRKLDNAAFAQENAWPRLASLKNAFEFLKDSPSKGLFPDDIVIRIDDLEKRLPKPCTYCHARGLSDFSPRDKCWMCKGTGLAGT